MAFVVEDGTGLADATSYASVDYASAFHFDHGTLEMWASIVDDEAALTNGTVALDGMFAWSGTILRDGSDGNPAQALDWPRVGVVDREGRVIASDAVPKAIADATCLMALYTKRQQLFEPVRTGVTSETIGDWSTHYSDGGAGLVRYPGIEMLVSGLVVGRPGGLRSVRMVRYS